MGKSWTQLSGVRGSLIGGGGLGGDDHGGPGTGDFGMKYKAIERATGVALSTTPALLFATPNEARSGWRLCNNLAVSIYLLVVPKGSPAPTFTAMVTNGDHDAVLAAGETAEDGASFGTDVYGCLAAGTGTVYPKEILE